MGKNSRKGRLAVPPAQSIARLTGPAGNTPAGPEALDGEGVLKFEIMTLRKSVIFLKEQLVNFQKIARDDVSRLEGENIGLRKKLYEYEEMGFMASLGLAQDGVELVREGDKVLVKGKRHLGPPPDLKMIKGGEGVSETNLKPQ